MYTKQLFKGIRKILATACLVSLISTYAMAQSNDIWDKYWSTANQIKKELNGSDFNRLAVLSSQLTHISTQILPDFIEKQPVCKEYITAAIKAAIPMQTMSLEDIERDYHADGKLPPMKDASCYHAKDLLVHPATISVIVKTLPDTSKNREMVAHELEEVLEHFSQVKAAALNK